MSSQYPIDRERLLTLAREDLACYATVQWPKFEFAKHHQLIISRLEAIERGEISRLMIFLPPRHGKSLIGSAIFPAWYLGRHPERHLIFATYGQELSDDSGRQVRDFIADPVHRAIFPGCSLREDSSAAHRFNTVRGGAYFAVGRGGPITGRGAHLLVIDDPLKDCAEANSETVRRALYDWYSSVAYTRLAPNGAIVLIQNRWHEDDLAGRLLANSFGDDWEVLSLPAIAEHDESFRREGEALWPDRFGLLELGKIRNALGGRAWASLYQQRPAAAEGTIFKRDWWQFYRPPVSAPFAQIVQSWDCAYKKGAENDFSACTTWGATSNGYYLIHLWKDKVEFPELRRVLGSLAEHWNPTAILVEDRASGQSLIQELKSSSVLPVIPVKVDSDKVARAQAATPLLEAGKLFLPEGASWVEDFIDELAVFPNGAHDDCVDSTTQALNFLRQEPPLLPISLGYSMFGSKSGELDKEDLWEKAMLGYALSEEEFNRL
jgi:predicted phage terminase large subunit-like protein